MSLVTNPPRQQRSRESLERIIIAGLEVLEHDGWDGFTIAEVARRANIGPAVIYRRFEDREALLMALHARFARDLMAEWLPGFRALARQDLDLDELAHGLLTELASSYRRYEGLMRFFLLHCRPNTRLAEAGDREIRALALEFEEALLVHQDEFGCADPQKAVAFCFQSALDTFLGFIAGGSRGPTYFDWNDLIKELTAMTLAYLRADTRPQMARVKG